MKKTLLTLLILLLGALLVYTVTQGWQIGNFNVLSYSQIKSKDKKLDEEVEKAKKLAQEDYEKEVDDEKLNKENLDEIKQQYENLVITDTETGEEITPQLEKYEMEYLWTQIGNHAKAEGVTLRINVAESSSTNNSSGEENEQSNEENSEENAENEDSNLEAAMISSVNSGVDQSEDASYDLTFEATGSYVAVADFIYAIENDSSLGFKIEDFQMTGESKTVVAKFTCRDIKIKKVSETTKEQSNDTNKDKYAEEENTNSTNTSK